MTKLAGSDVVHSSSDNKGNEEINVKTLAEQLLSRRMFVGVYLERRWVGFLKEFRDVIVINDTGNEELIKDLSYAMKRLREFYGERKWIGMTGPDCVGAPTSFCLWVKTQNLPLGQHEFCIRKVKFTDNEISTTVKSMKLMDTDFEHLRRNEPVQNDFNNWPPLNFEDKIIEIQNQGREMLEYAYSLLTMDNIKSVISIVILVAIVLFNFTLSSIKGIGIFSLKFMDQFTKLVHALMPLLLSIMDLLKKTIGGLFILFSMIFRELFGIRTQNSMAVNYSDEPRYLMGPTPQHSEQYGYNKFGPNTRRPSRQNRRPRTYFVPY